ncbi:MAG TPA: DinB family protein [Thermomicrobiales bacterium]|nr:DinB family protein [Thermomicrobiales bacterium]
MDVIDRLLEHDDWGTKQLFELSRDLTDAQLDQPFDIGHQTLRQTFDHLIFNIAFWTGLMVGKPLEARQDYEQAERSMAQMTERYGRYWTAFATLARQVSDEHRLDDTFVDHWGERPTLGGAVVHVVLHNAEHRTELVHMLTRLGVSPEALEVDHLLWEHKTKSV